jgi:hypothetical protein
VAAPVAGKQLLRAPAINDPLSSGEKAKGRGCLWEIAFTLNFLSGPDYQNFFLKPGL